MTVHAPSTRRDRRYELRPGAGVVDWHTTTARLLRISAAGIAFRVEEPVPALAPGSCLYGVRVRVGACVLDGDISIRDVRKVGLSEVEIGGVFLPCNHEVEARLMALVSGIDAAPAD